MSKTKLELTWIGKDQQPRLEPRILLEDSSKSYGKGAQNLLIHGDNLLALKALEQEYAGKVKCIYIDPPYNTGSAFEHYDDGIEHSLWLSLIRDRVASLHGLLKEDGSIWISIDDNECHYIKVLCDEIFGRRNFITTAIWQKKYAAKADSKFLSESHDYILIYAKDIEKVKLNRMPRTQEQDARYKNADNDPRGVWTSGDLLRNEARDYAIYEIIGPSGRKHLPPEGTSWRFTKERFAELVLENRIWFGANGDNVPRLKRFLTDVADSVPATTWWEHKDVGHNDEAKKEIRALFESDLFGTPKPERLINRIFHLATNPGDLVLDSFLGSGTTAAVAHKMGRRWIGIELGDHCYTHCIPRLQKVIDGQDPGGITEAVGWKGGGGFKFYELAPSLLNKDEFGNHVISPEYNPAMLAAAMAKHEGFRYDPDPITYWKQGRSTERDYIFTTTKMLTVQEVERIAMDMPSGETLLICCKAYQDGVPHVSPFITIKKIPHMLLGRCEFGKDDYSLHIVPAPQEETNGEDDVDAVENDSSSEPQVKAAPAKKTKKAKGKAVPDLFGDEE